MDTAQRYELGWPAARALIERCGELALPNGFVAGAGVDHLARVERPADLIDGVVEQIAIIRAAGGLPIILALPWLSVRRCDPAIYVEVYGAIAREAGGPLLVHWLGPMFHPDLEGYFPADSFDRIMERHAEAIRGAKLSLLDPARERSMRRRLRARDQLVLTGDDLHFAELIVGADAPPDGETVLDGRPVLLGDFSHALLGVLDALAVPAGLALRLLAAGDGAACGEILAAGERLGRILFEPPVHAYKAGLAFLAWLNGHQPHRRLLHDRHLDRSPEHLARVLRAATEAGALGDARRAAERLAAIPDRI
jgi:hypothetical protein